MTKERQEEYDKLHWEYVKMSIKLEQIVKEDNYEKKQELFKKIDSITRKTEVDSKDIEYLKSCSNNISFHSYINNFDITLYDIELYIDSNNLNVSHCEEGPSYEGAWGDMENDTIADFDYYFKIEKPLLVKYINGCDYSEITVYLKCDEPKKEYIYLTFTLDENKMKEN